MSELMDYSPAEIMAAISKALNAGDMTAAAALVRLLAVKDPASAQLIIDAIDMLDTADRAEATVTATGDEGGSV